MSPNDWSFDALNSTSFPMLMFNDIFAKNVFPSIENSSITAYLTSFHLCCSLAFVRADATPSLRDIIVAVIDDARESQAASYSLAGIVAAAFVIAKLTKRSKLDTIPTDVIQEGYDKYKGAPFKVSKLYRWVVVVSGRQHLEELRKAPDDELSFQEATNEMEYMAGQDVHHNSYHVPIIRSQLTRNLGILYPEINDELVTAFEETLDLKGDEWKSVPALHTVQKVICRTSNRIFVGLPLCRNPDWVDLNIQFIFDIVKGGIIIRLFPKFMAPFVARFMTSIPGSTRRVMKHLGPIIEERKKCLEEYGPAWAGKPNDLLSWLMDEATGSQYSIESLTRRILAVNFAAIHTSSNASLSFTQALFNLAANPQYIQPLREEVESIVGTEGWSTGALAKMHKIDSFLTESLRFEGLSCVTLSRKAMKDFTFSDGTVIPKGTVVVVASAAAHHDNEFYKNADMFDPFRFSNMRDEAGEGVMHQFVSTGPEYLPFGHGSHSCPGRFFAANELKSMLAHIITRYDIKLEDGIHPQSLRIGTAIVANPTAKVLFRERAL
ncbi:cytochrome P450 [Melanogaster broomeanus]|nr:cytochrome P450 [Melanogaster broomeanus]